MGTEGPNGNGGTARAGTRALALLATPISGKVLRCLADGPKRLVDLRGNCGSPAQTTLRAYLNELDEVGAIERHRRHDFPGTVECELTPAGHELLSVASVVDRWLETAPDGPIQFGSATAKAAINALTEGWSSMMLRALAARPLTLTELDGVIGSLTYPSLERRLTAMKRAGQVEPCPGDGKGTPYAPTRWLREGIAPLAAATRWERRHLPEGTAPIGRMDVETAFLLALPLAEAPTDISGSCRFGIEMRSGSERRLVGAMAYAEDGQLSCSVRLENTADGWATGSTTAWLQAVIGGATAELELGGDQRLARRLIESLHVALFGRSTAVAVG
jgi:DNA-binding HxlR family transcriptional regulator